MEDFPTKAVSLPLSSHGLKRRTRAMMLTHVAAFLLPEFSPNDRSNAEPGLYTVTNIFRINRSLGRHGPSNATVIEV